MKIDMLGVQAFIAVADQGGFRRAAATLHITQTALSRRLINLESFLGVKLIERSTRSIALTSVGEEFLPEGRRLLADLSTVLMGIRETGKSRLGNVSLACVPALAVRYLPRIIQEYSSRFPGNGIQIMDKGSAAVESAVLRREVEFGVCVKGRHHDELSSVDVVRDTFVMVCRDDHPVARRDEISWSQAQEHQLIYPGVGNANRPLLDTALEALDLNLQKSFEVQRSATAIGLAAEGVGPAVVPLMALQTRAYPNLRVIPLAEPTVHKQYVLLRRKLAQLSPAAQALCDMILGCPTLHSEAANSQMAA
jgi:DNA-binding transcriptional LysR family regulator